MGLPIRLQKILASAGFGSRRGCEAYILEGRVSVDGSVVMELGAKADVDSQSVELDGRKIAGPGKLAKGARDNDGKIYYALNKPKGALCTNDDPAGRPIAVNMIPEKRRIFCVGRLDLDTEGLILLTNDGDLTNQLTHPRYGVPKTYIARVEGELTPSKMAKLQGGVHFAEGRTQGAKVRVRKKEGRFSLLEITISEGMNRQVRRMLARVDLKCRHLKRVAIGPIKLNEMQPGEYRLLTADELERLRKAITDAETASKTGLNPTGKARRLAEKGGKDGAKFEEREEAASGMTFDNADDDDYEDEDDEEAEVGSREAAEFDASKIPARNLVNASLEDEGDDEEEDDDEIEIEDSDDEMDIDADLEGEEVEIDDDEDEEEVVELKAKPAAKAKAKAADTVLEDEDEDEDDEEDEADEEDEEEDDVIVVDDEEVEVDTEEELKADADSTEAAVKAMDEARPWEKAAKKGGKVWADRGDVAPDAEIVAAFAENEREEARKQKEKYQAELAEREAVSGPAERKPWQKREGSASSSGERKPWQKREGGSGSGGGERKPWQKREGGSSFGGERKPYQKREGGSSFGGERKPWQNREGGSSSGGGERKPYQKREGGSSYGGERKPYVKREGGSSFGGERKPWQKREGGSSSGGDRKPYVKREGGSSFGGERKPWQKREGGSSSGGDRKPYVKREGGSGFGGERKPWQNREGGSSSGGDRKPYVKREGGSSYGGERKPYVKREGSGFGGERKPYVKREGSGFGGERKPYVKREGGSGYGGGERKPYVKREGSGFGGERKPYVKRDDSASREQTRGAGGGYGDRRPWENKDRGERGASGGDRGRSGGGFKKPWTPGGSASSDSKRNTRPWEKGE